MRDNTEKKSGAFTIILAFLVFIFGGIAGYLYYQYSLSQKELSKLQDPEYLSELQEQQVGVTIEKLAQIMLLPEEDPTIATLIDVDALREENESFYKNAENGDKLVIYSEQAILFREEENKIINVAPVFIEPTDSTEDTKSTTSSNYNDDDTVEEEDNESENNTY